MPVIAFHFADVVGSTAAPPPIGDAQPREIDFAQFLDAWQPAEKRVHASENVQRASRRISMKLVHVARIGNEPVLGANRKVGDEIHHQREDVIERQRRDHDFLAGPQRIRHESLELLGIGDEVAMRQRRAFREPRGAAGILQEQKIVAIQRNRREGKIRALSENVGECDNAR